MLFDEPTSAFDPELRGEVQRMMRDLAEEGMTMLVVTHEMNFVRAVADRVLFFDDGLIEEQGTLEQIFNEARNPRTREFLSPFAENYRRNHFCPGPRALSPVSTAVGTFCRFARWQDSHFPPVFPLPIQ